MIQKHTRHVAILSLSLFLPESQSLKDKRMVLRALKDKMRAKFNISVAELDTLDKWQIAICGIAMIGNDQRYLDGCIQNILSFIEGFDQIRISDYEISFI